MWAGPNAQFTGFVVRPGLSIVIERRTAWLTLFCVHRQATRILFANPESNNLLATGVEYEVFNKSYTVNATREVILAAGTVQTPQLLELSGQLT